MALNGLHTAQAGRQFIFSVGYGSGDGTENYRSVIVRAYTPRDPVIFDQFPDNDIQYFQKSRDVRGYPTLAVLPDKVTADARSERVIAWSQGPVVYRVETTGRYTDEEVLELAREISAKEEGTR